MLGATVATVCSSTSFAVWPASTDCDDAALRGRGWRNSPEGTGLAPPRPLSEIKCIGATMVNNICISGVNFKIQHPGTPLFAHDPESRLRHLVFAPLYSLHLLPEFAFPLVTTILLSVSMSLGFFLFVCFLSFFVVAFCFIPCRSETHRNRD